MANGQEIDGELVCSTCGLGKPISSFYPINLTRCKSCIIEYSAQRKKRLGLSNKELHYRKLAKEVKAAKRARRDADYFKKFGIERERAMALLSAPNATCEICGRIPAGVRANTLCIDHDHSTGKFRGVLCSTCNYGLGMFKDKKENLLAAFNYLSSK